MMLCSVTLYSTSRGYMTLAEFRGAKIIKEIKKGYIVYAVFLLKLSIGMERVTIQRIL